MTREAPVSMAGSRPIHRNGPQKCRYSREVPDQHDELPARPVDSAATPKWFD